MTPESHSAEFVPPGEPVAALVMGTQVMVCSMGCCPGCQNCYGMSIGCHQEPCRCELPCTCRWKDEENDPRWREGCERHDSTHDQRRYADADPEDYLDDEDLGYLGVPCPECGSSGACAYDHQGRPLIHATPEEDQ